MLQRPARLDARTRLASHRIMGENLLCSLGQETGEGADSTKADISYSQSTVCSTNSTNRHIISRKAAAASRCPCERYTTRTADGDKENRDAYLFLFQVFGYVGLHHSRKIFRLDPDFEAEGESRPHQIKLTRALRNITIARSV